MQHGVQRPHSPLSNPRTPLADEKIRFDDGAGYEQMMGKWSQLVGAGFLDWLALPAGLKWLDVGCGNGAFTEMLVDRCAPSAISGIDPSEGQLRYARERPASRLASFQLGDAMALPFANHEFDTAVMALVIFFVPDPARGVAEMVRVVRPGGWVSAYAWDILEGGFPLAAVQDQMRAMGITPMLPPSAAVSKMAALRAAWTDGGLESVQTTEITVKRTFADFDDYWRTAMLGSSVGPKVAAMSTADRELLSAGVRDRLGVSGAGQITISARANAVRGRVPG